MFKVYMPPWKVIRPRELPSTRAGSVLPAVDDVPAATVEGAPAAAFEPPPATPLELVPALALPPTAELPPPALLVPVAPAFELAPQPNVKTSEMMPSVAGLNARVFTGPIMQGFRRVYSKISRAVK